jgi:hypothetical protein
VKDATPLLVSASVSTTHQRLRMMRPLTVHCDPATGIALIL